MKPTPHNSESHQTTAKKRLSEGLEKIAVEWPPDLPKPPEFPATLKDFLRLIVNAKTPADCMQRLRQFLRERGPRSSFWVDNPTPADKADTWVVSRIQAIREEDRKGGFFTDQWAWLKLASAYTYWWKEQKSIKASESAKKRKPRS
jgi:hypothetical protein